MLKCAQKGSPKIAQMAQCQSNRGPWWQFNGIKITLGNFLANVWGWPYSSWGSLYRYPLQCEVWAIFWANFYSYWIATQADIEFVLRNSIIFRSFFLPLCGSFHFKPVFVCIFTVHADENWLENERNHIQGRKNDLNMLLLRSTNSMSESVPAVS